MENTTETYIQFVVSLMNSLERAELAMNNHSTKLESKVNSEQEIEDFKKIQQLVVDMQKQIEDTIERASAIDPTFKDKLDAFIQKNSTK